MRDAVLVLVHPGSCVGSADFNIGRQAARAGREGIARQLLEWQGGFVVIYGQLCDELPSVPTLSAAISVAYARARDAGLVAESVHGDDPTQDDAVREIVMAMPAAAAQALRWEVTGAWWYRHDSTFGCVNSVVKELRRLGCRAQVSETAFQADAEQEQEQEACSASNNLGGQSAMERQR